MFRTRAHIVHFAFAPFFLLVSARLLTGLSTDPIPRDENTGPIRMKYVCVHVYVCVCVVYVKMADFFVN